MHFVSISIRFLMARRLVFPAVLCAINLASAITAFHAGDWRRGVYFISSALCVAMASI
jgi:hypothetical protein